MPKFRHSPLILLLLAVSIVPALAGATPCSDGLDNDGDMLIDFPDDPGCVSALGNSEGYCEQGADNDLDGVGTVCDCNDADPTARRGAKIVTDVLLEKIVGGVRLSWADQNWTGSSVVYDLFGIDGGTLRADGGDFSSGACLADGHATFTYDDLSALPAPGALTFVLIRAENGCGTGYYGTLERDTTTALSPATCVNQPEELCGDGYDNDLDGEIDCTDADCFGVGGCPLPDLDGDGWTAADNDCCETPAQCPAPSLVNPGAFEIVGNGIDDDCDPGTSDVTPPAACSVAADFSIDAGQLAQAMELCQTTTVAPPLAARKWGLLSAEILFADGGTPTAPQLAEMLANQGAVLENYGSGGVLPLAGPTMAGLSNGRMRDANDAGFVAPNTGTDFGRSGNPPASYLAAHAGTLPGSFGCNGACPSGAGANDSINLRLTVRVPTNADTLHYKLRFFSAEYWQYACGTYNDFHLSLLDSSAVGLPADGNIAYDSQANPLTVNSGFFDVCVPQGCYTCPLGSGPLAGTGMEIANTGGGTDWLDVTAPVVPGETIVLDLMVFDVSDGTLDSLVLIDDFGWGSAINYELYCDNGLDEDGDTLIDCLDPDCDTRDGCEFGLESTCTDGLDNDGDANVDCGDSDCAGDPSCAPEADCANGLDDDTDGSADCLDSDCDQVGICEFGVETTCNDGLDNDGDADVDCADADCFGVGGCAVVDADGDGWTVADNDCCETPAQCPAPSLVNPGAFEIVGNGIDDDCDPGTSDVTPPAACSVAADFSIDAGQLAQAMELCQTTTVAPPLAARKWGLLSAEILFADGGTPTAPQLAEMLANQGAVLENYGSGGVLPLAGPTMAGLSNGRMRDANDAGFVAPNTGTDFGRSGNPPASYLAAHAGTLPGSFGCSGACPAGAGANDSANLRLTIRVPTNADTLHYKLRFFSAEYWQWSCSTYNDFHLSLLDSSAVGLPADGNIAYDSQANPLTVNSGFFDVCVPQGCYTCPLGSGPLAGTGMEIANTGGGTDWLDVTAPVVPGETIVLDLMVFDVSDGTLDSLVLIDDFSWGAAEP